MIYVNGAVGAMASPLDVPAWEVSERAPIGDGYTPPPNAVPPGSAGRDFVVRNFRKAILVGEQLGVAVEALLREATPLEPTRLDVRHQPFFTRMSNIGFRKLAVVDPESGRPGIGFKAGDLYTCPATGPKTPATCQDDGRATEEDPVVGLIRKGDHTRSAVSLVQMGDLTLAFLPGEVPGELVMGLPKGIKATPERWADETPSAHTPPDQIAIPGYVKRMLPGTWTWAVGLGNDELGYILPLSNYRVLCVADKLGGRRRVRAGSMPLASSTIPTPSRARAARRSQTIRRRSPRCPRAPRARPWLARAATARRWGEPRGTTRRRTRWAGTPPRT